MNINSVSLFSDLLSLVENVCKIGGGFWLVWGVVKLAGAINDHNGPEVKQSIWQIVGGAMIIVAAAWFGKIVS